ncbi:MAG TPA: hypothetical protein VMN56_03550 [Casimicrobiaceae bacterium]|nr:hypothetical protein [Casimicrobiaceae bacterium]
MLNTPPQLDWDMTTWTSSTTSTIESFTSIITSAISQPLHGGTK